MVLLGFLVFFPKVVFGCGVFKTRKKMGNTLARVARLICDILFPLECRGQKVK